MPFLFYISSPIFVILLLSINELNSFKKTEVCRELIEIYI
jgi:hypothetical protein